MRKVKLLGMLGSLIMMLCLLSSCGSIEAEFGDLLKSALDTLETDEGTEPTDWGAEWETPQPGSQETNILPPEPSARPAETEFRPTQAPVQPIETPVITEAVYDPDDVQEPFYGLGWFQTVMGSTLYLPGGFVQQSTDGYMKAPGTHTYVFWNNALGMKIEVFECTRDFLPVTPAEDYQRASSAAGVTYATARNSFYVVSGYSDSKNIYYTRVDYNEEFYHSLSFYYPTANADACEEILLEFLNDYSIG